MPPLVKSFIPYTGKWIILKHNLLLKKQVIDTTFSNSIVRFKREKITQKCYAVFLFAQDFSRASNSFFFYFLGHRILIKKVRKGVDF